MTTVSRPAMAAVLLAAALGAGCATAPARGLHATPPSLGRLPYSDADVDFMSIEIGVMTQWNAQDEQTFVWPRSFALARAYLDQLERSKGPCGRDDRRSADRPHRSRLQAECRRGVSRRSVQGAHALDGRDRPRERTALIT